MGNTNLTTASLADTVRSAGRDRSNLILGDTDHSSIDMSVALISPDVIRAAAQSGRTAIILERLSDPAFEAYYNRFRNGEISIDQVRRDFATTRSSWISEQDQPRMQEALVQMFQTLKDNNMQLLSVDRDTNGPLPAELARPEFTALRERLERATETGGPAAVQAIVTQLVTERGEGYINDYNAWFGQRMDDANRVDAERIRSALTRANNPNALIVWGDSHNQGLNDLDEVLGNSAVVSVYLSQSSQQFRMDGNQYRSELPEYAYYLSDGLTGKAIAGNDISNPKDVSVTSQTALDGLRNNSLAGMLEGFTLVQNLQWQDESRRNLGTNLDLATSRGPGQPGTSVGPNL